MRAADRSLDVIAFVSEHFREIIRRRFSELAGIALITLALLGALALATWSVQDPSLSHATQRPIHNLLGYPGAIFSDLAMQLLGLAAILLTDSGSIARMAVAVAQNIRREMAKPVLDPSHVPRGSVCLGAAAHRILAIAHGARRRRRRCGAAPTGDGIRRAAR